MPIPESARLTRAKTMTAADPSLQHPRAKEIRDEMIERAQIGVGSLTTPADLRVALALVTRFKDANRPKPRSPFNR
jgi:hypothetical protein